MDNNDVVRRLRYALDLSDSHMLDIFARSGKPITRQTFLGLLQYEGHADYVECTDALLAQLLDGLIIERRGPRSPSAPPPPAHPMTNNTTLRKLRIAFSYKDVDMLRVLQRGGMRLSTSELSALFRKAGNRHYRAAGDQLMRAFFAGLAKELRAAPPPAP